VLLIPFINVSNLYGITALLFFFAVSADAFRPANAVAISHFSTPDTLTRSYSLMRLAYNLGFGIGPAIGGVVIAAFGFKWLFFIDGVTCLIAGILLFFYFIRRFKSAENTNQWNITKPQGMSAFKDGYFLAFVVSVVFFCLCFMQMFTSIPVHFAQDLQHSEMTVGLLLALNGILVFIIEMPIVAKYQNHPQKMNLISIGCGLMFVSYLFLLPFNKSLFFPVLFTFFITIAEIFAMPFMMNFVVNRPDPSRRGQYSSLYSIAFGLGFIFAPAIGLWIAEHYGFLTLFISVALLSFLPTFAFYKLGQKIKF
jgi:predicted MFS family arabinose efflux permease